MLQGIPLEMQFISSQATRNLWQLRLATRYAKHLNLCRIELKAYPSISIETPSRGFTSHHPLYLAAWRFFLPAMHRLSYLPDLG